MTAHYFITEFQLDAARTPMIPDSELNELLREGEWLLSGQWGMINDMLQGPQWEWLDENRDTQW